MNRNVMWAGVHDASSSGLAVFLPLIALVAIAWGVTSPFTIRHARMVQRIGQVLVGSLKRLAERDDPRS